MMSNANTKKAAHLSDDEIVALLPFYVKGQLERVDQEQVEAWLNTSPSASKALERVSDELSANIETHESISPPSGALARLNASIEDQGLSRPQKKSWTERFNDLTNLLDFGDRRLAWATAMALLLVVAIQSGIGPSQSPQSGYELAAGKDGSDIVGPTATVAFHETATISVISAHLSAHGARIISGPRGTGFYIVQFDRDMNGQTLKARLEKFKNDTSVVRLFQIKTEDGQ